MANEKRLIDVDALIAYFEKQYNVAMDDPDPVSGYVMSALRCCIEHFKTIPTIDAVEVVRCNDCKHLKYGYQCYYPLGMMLNNDGHAYVLVDPDDDFCSRGERREGE